MSKLQIQINKLISARAAAIASIEGIDAKLAELQPLRDAEREKNAARSAIEVVGLSKGTLVSYSYGRAEKRRDLAGEVVAFNPETKFYRIQTGTGFDVELHTVPAAAIIDYEVAATEPVTAEQEGGQ